MAGFFDDRVSGAAFAREMEAGTFHALYGPPDNVFRVYTALAIHEAALVLHLAGEFGNAEDDAAIRTRRSERTTAAVLRAAALRHPALPVVVARPARELRLLDSMSGTNPHGVARFGEVFGGIDRRSSGVVTRAIDAALVGAAIAPGEGSPRDFVFVRDAARACLAVAEEVGSGTSIDATFRSGWVLTGTEMARAVQAAFSGQVPLVAVDHTPENPFGWEPQHTFEESLRETVDEYRHRNSTTLQIPGSRRAA